MKDKLIVGIDPGTTAGVALINLNGKLIDIKSGKNFGREKIISYIISNGTPVIIATDKAKVPSNVEKISRSFDAKLVTPKKDLSQEEKGELTEDIDLEDSHQMDALASALNAYKINSEKLDKIEDTLQKLNLLDHVEKVKSKVLKEDSENITAAIESVIQGERENEKEENIEGNENNMEEEREETGERVDDLKEELTQTKDAVKTLKEYSEKLKEQKQNLEKRLEERKEEIKKIKEGRKDKVMKMDEVKRLGKTVQSLRRGLKKQESKKEGLKKRIETMKRIEERRREGLLTVYVLNNFNGKKLERIKDKYGLEKSILLFENIESPNLSLVEYLKENQVKALIGEFEGDLREEIIKNDIPIISKEKIEFEDGIEDKVKFLESQELESGKNVDKQGFVSWLKKYKKR